MLVFGFHGLGLTESFRAMFEDIFVGVYKGQNACRVLGFGLRGFEGFGLGANVRPVRKARLNRCSWTSRDIMSGYWHRQATTTNVSNSEPLRATQDGRRS